MYENIFVMPKKKFKKKNPLKIDMAYSGRNRNLASILFQGVKNISYVF